MRAKPPQSCRSDSVVSVIIVQTKHDVSPIAYIHKSVLKNAPLPQRLATAPAIILADAGSVESRANAPSISTAPPFKMCACKQNKHDVSLIAHI